MDESRRRPCKRGVLSRAVPAKQRDTLKLQNPFPGQKPFRPSYDKKETPNITSLLNWDYYRQWKEELDEFLSERKERYTPPKKTFPIYRKIIKVVKKPEKLIVPNKKYADVKSRVFDTLPMDKTK